MSEEDREYSHELVELKERAEDLVDRDYIETAIAAVKKREEYYEDLLAGAKEDNDTEMINSARRNALWLRIRRRTLEHLIYERDSGLPVDPTVSHAINQNEVDLSLNSGGDEQ